MVESEPFNLVKNDVKNAFDLPLCAFVPFVVKGFRLSFLILHCAASSFGWYYPAGPPTLRATSLG